MPKVACFLFFFYVSSGLWKDGGVGMRKASSPGSCVPASRELYRLENKELKVSIVQNREAKHKIQTLRFKNRDENGV